MVGCSIPVAKNYYFSCTFSNPMALTEERYQKRRLQTSYLSTIVSISLVLYMLGVLSMLLLNAKKLSDIVRENIRLSVIMNDNVSQTDIMMLKKSLDISPFVKTTEYITKEQAAKILQNDLQEDFLNFIGYNPLLPSIEVYVRSAWANNDSLAKIEKKVLSNSGVKEVFYQKSLVKEINDNVKKISVILLGFSILLLVVAIALINNTIRLAVYSKRFIIRSMQLVGATQSFIRKPFILRSIVHGLAGAFIALLLLSGTIYLFINQLPELMSLQEIDLYLSLFGIVITLGIIISCISTYFAVRKYLRLKTDYLYMY